VLGLTSPSLTSSFPSASSDYWKSDTMFDLKYCNWNKDMLMGVLPNSQFGDVAVLDISNSGTSDVVLGPDNKKSKVGVASAVTSNSAPVPFFALQASASNTVPASSTLRVDLSTLQSQFTVLALRQAEALQRWKEKNKYKYFDSDKWVEYGTSIGNTIGNFMPHRVISSRR
jgi:hypothetical protein